MRYDCEAQNERCVIIFQDWTSFKDSDQRWMDEDKDEDEAGSQRLPM